MPSTSPQKKKDPGHILSACYLMPFFDSAVLDQKLQTNGNSVVVTNQLDMEEEFTFDKVFHDQHEFAKLSYQTTIAPLVKKTIAGECSVAVFAGVQSLKLNHFLLSQTVMQGLLSQAAGQLLHSVLPQNGEKKVGSVTFSWYKIDCTSAENITDVLRTASTSQSSGGEIHIDNSLLLREQGGKGRGMIVPSLWEVEIASGADIEAVIAHVQKIVPIADHGIGTAHTVMQLTVVNHEKQRIAAEAEAAQLEASGSPQKSKHVNPVIVVDPPGTGRLTFVLLSNIAPSSASAAAQAVAQAASERNNSSRGNSLYRSPPKASSAAGKSFVLDGADRGGAPPPNYPWVDTFTTTMQWLDSKRPSAPFHKSRLLLLLRDMLLGRMSGGVTLLMQPSEKQHSTNAQWLRLIGKFNRESVISQIQENEEHQRLLSEQEQERRNEAYRLELENARNATAQKGALAAPGSASLSARGAGDSNNRNINTNNGNNSRGAPSRALSQAGEVVSTRGSTSTTGGARTQPSTQAISVNQATEGRGRSSGSGSGSGSDSRSATPSGINRAPAASSSSSLSSRLNSTTTTTGGFGNSSNNNTNNHSSNSNALKRSSSAPRMGRISSASNVSSEVPPPTSSRLQHIQQQGQQQQQRQQEQQQQQLPSSRSGMAPSTVSALAQKQQQREQQQQLSRGGSAGNSAVTTPRASAAYVEPNVIVDETGLITTSGGQQQATSYADKEELWAMQKANEDLLVALEASKCETAALKLAYQFSNEKYHETRVAYEAMVEQLKEEGGMLRKRDQDRFKNALKDLKDYEIYKQVMEAAMVRLQNDLDSYATENQQLKESKMQENRLKLKKADYNEKYTKDLFATKRKLQETESKMMNLEKQHKSTLKEKETAVSALAHAKMQHAEKEGRFAAEMAAKNMQLETLKSQLAEARSQVAAVSADNKALLISHAAEVKMLRDAHTKGLETLMTYQEENDVLRGAVSSLSATTNTKTHTNPNPNTTIGEERKSQTTDEQS